MGVRFSAAVYLAVMSESGDNLLEVLANPGDYRPVIVMVQAYNRSTNSIELGDV
jgi:hypothetical protein